MSTFGKVFRVTTFGESHCAGVGAIIDGVPPQMQLSEADIQPQLSRRRPGQNALTTQRDEKDQVKILSGTEFGRTLGTPIGLMVANQDHRPGDYASMNAIPRPSHADFTYFAKYGTHASSGGGRSSARETIGRVAAGAIAEKWLRLRFGVEIIAFVSGAGTERLADEHVELATISRSDVDETLMRCPHKETAERMMKQVEEAKEAHDSIGGIVTCVCRNVPAGLGEPCFDKLEAMLAHAMMSIPATKGFEIGSGFAGTRMHGSEHNDAFEGRADGTLGTVTNRSGGIQGGISNGEAVLMRIAFKPPATIGQAQATVDYAGTPAELAARGRHDPCVVNRAVPIVEAMAALVLADAAMIQLARAASIAPRDALPLSNLRDTISEVTERAPK